VGHGKESDMAKGKDEKVVREIIRHYGATLDLKSSPYLIVEIIRRYSTRLDGGVVASCLPPGGPPKVLDPSDIIQELKARAAEVNRLLASLEKALMTNRTQTATKAKLKRK
jgi:hypothetical protein